MFYLWLRPRPHLPIGLHGALLPFLLLPLGFMEATALGFLEVSGGGISWFQLQLAPWGFVASAFACILIAYYLVWKYLVDFFNRVVEVA